MPHQDRQLPVKTTTVVSLSNELTKQRIRKNLYYSFEVSLFCTHSDELLDSGPMLTNFRINRRDSTPDPSPDKASRILFSLTNGQARQDLLRRCLRKCLSYTVQL
ncbi:hypothetical protein PoB_001272800 [Plakobranchus ocellatus]|uniref:Uncharacterized protein n=1 Tax=Plakobranchus ocellatus TaxID=259542 RepID=A0AAV3YUI6_9GAST|nr:hypothetical protein PoB_001272800 [Plakobranchus ocellatus]